VDRVGTEDLEQRRASRHPLAAFQAVKQHAADMLILSAGAFLLAIDALAAVDAERAAAPVLWRARSGVPRTYKDVSLWAHQLHGGMGYARVPAVPIVRAPQTSGGGNRDTPDSGGRYRRSPRQHRSLNLAIPAA
jgi:hypothetical protein